MSLYLSTITAAIAGLSISGVTIKDTDEVAESWLSQPRVLYPNPNEPGFVTDLSSERNIIGGLDSVSYAVHYRYLSTQVNDAFPANWNAVIGEAMDIMDALLAASESVDNIDMTASLDSVGAKEDPAGNAYNGADITITVTEHH